MENYTPPVDRLLTYGDCRKIREANWQVYIDELALTKEHIPELINMATDYELFESDDENSWSATIHAWRILGVLQAEEAIQPLLEFFDDYEDDDFTSNDLMIALGMIGAASLPLLTEYITNPYNETSCRSYVGYAIEKVAEYHSEVKDQSVSILCDVLKEFKKNDRSLNGIIIGSLLSLKAKEALPLIKKAFDANVVDLSVVGDYEEVEIEFGVRIVRSTPAMNWFVVEYMQRHVSEQNELNSLKIGRNEPCPCRSGKKYKKCCGK